MSYPNDAPAAAWYPDPQTSGQVRWWDGQNWTEHVSKPAVEQPAASIVPQVAEADAAFAAADSDAAAQANAHIATVTFIGRHAAGATPVPRQPSTAPRIRPRVRATVPADAQLGAQVEALAYA